MPKSRSHEECRACVCLLCFSKTKVIRNITESAREVIHRNITNIDFDDVRLPTEMCSNCYTIVYEYKKDNYSRTIPLYEHAQLANNGLSPIIRGNAQCSCKVCKIARASTTSNFNTSTSVIQKRKPGPSASTARDSTVKPTALKLCSFCLCVLARGKPHTCTSTQRHGNLLSLASMSTARLCSDEKLASSIIRQKMKDALDTNDEDTDDHLNLSSARGQPMKIVVSPATKASKKVTADDMARMRCDLNLSTNQTKILCIFANIFCNFCKTCNFVPVLVQM